MAKYVRVSHPSGDYKAKLIEEKDNYFILEIFGKKYGMPKEDCTPCDSFDNLPGPFGQALMPEE